MGRVSKFNPLNQRPRLRRITNERHSKRKKERMAKTLEGIDMKRNSSKA